MPTYTYQCKECGYEYDALQSMSEEPHTECPQCGGAVARLIGGGAGIHFKGSGFYVTDYKSKSGKPSSDASSSGSSSSAASSGGAG